MRNRGYWLLRFTRRCSCVRHQVQRNGVFVGQCNLCGAGCQIHSSHPASRAPERIAEAFAIKAKFAFHFGASPTPIAHRPIAVYHAALFAWSVAILMVTPARTALTLVRTMSAGCGFGIVVGLFTAGH